MFFGRFVPIVLVLALAGAFAAQGRRPVTAGTMPTDTPLFAVLLAGTVVVVAGLTFFPALALGPIAEALYHAPTSAPPDPRPAWDALPQAFAKLDPRHVFRSPVIFVVWVGSVLTTVLAVKDPSVFAISVTLWLWATVLFANLAEAVAEGRGKAQAETLRKTRTETTARRLRDDGSEEKVRGTELRARRPRGRRGRPGDPRRRRRRRGSRHGRRVGDHRRVRPVIRESGGDRCAVTGGTTVLSDRIVVKVTSRARRDLHRPDDRAGRGCVAAEDAQRDRPDHPADDADHHLPLRRGRACSRWRSTPGRGCRSSCSSPCSSASSRPRSVRCSPRSASPAWTASCSTTCSPCPAAPSRPPATSTPCCSTRPAPSPSATGRPARSCPSTDATREELLRAAYLSSPRRRDPRGPLDRRPRPRRTGWTRPPARSPSCAGADAEFVPSPPPPGCPGVDLPDGTPGAQGRRLRRRRVGRGSGGHVAARPALRRRRHQRRTAAPRSSWRSPSPGPRPHARASSTSRTSSSPACANGSTSCGPWASAP